jgi:dTDP-4-amino-4,6-dideoxygalactose transaminase
VRYKVPFIKPVLPASELIADDYAEIVASNWFTNFGPKEREFSAGVAEYIGNGFHAVTFANATIALMGLAKAVLGEGDRTRFVLVPSFTFAAGPAAIEWSGHRPLFIDIDPHTLQPSIDSARRAIETHGAAIAGILFCNTFGIGASTVREWEALASELGLPMMVDSAAGFGSRYADSSVVGRAGIAEVFSFHATKPFAIGEGGAVVTRDAELALTLREFQNFGFGQGKGALKLGLNGKLQELNAAIGLRQLARIDAAVESRRSVLASYREELEPLGVHFPDNIERSSVCFASVVLPDGQRRDRALEHLISVGVEARAYYTPLVHHQPHFDTCPTEGDLMNTDAISARVLSLPVHEAMPDDSVALVTASLREVLGR